MKIELGVNNEGLGNARRSVALRIASDLSEHIPYKTGKLYHSEEIAQDGSYIRYPCEYSQYAFNPVAPSGKMKKYNKEVHKYAKGEPLEYNLEAKKAVWEGYFREEINHINLIIARGRL